MILQISTLQEISTPQVPRIIGRGEEGKGQERRPCQKKKKNKQTKNP
jgi:hypothetical protein